MCEFSLGHHIGERAHLVEREQNVYSGDQEEHQEYINIEEDEAEDFNRFVCILFIKLIVVRSLHRYHR